MLHGTFKEATHMAPLHARIPLYKLATLQLTSPWQEIILTFTQFLCLSAAHAPS